jgi:hypothetical protein
MRIRQQIINGQHSKNMEMNWINIFLMQVPILTGSKLKDQNKINTRL